MKKIGALMGMLAVFVLASCGRDYRKIADGLLENAHERELIDIVEQYKTAVENLSSCFDITDSGEFALSASYRESCGKVIDSMLSFHDQYHSEKLLPRKSARWYDWMYFYDNPNIEDAASSVTVCPFCRSIHNRIKSGRTDLDVSFTDTYLHRKVFVPKAHDELLDRTGNAFLVNMIVEGYYPVVASKELFSEKQGEVCLALVKKEYGTYYVNVSKRLQDVYGKIIAHHEKYHKFASDYIRKDIWMNGSLGKNYTTEGIIMKVNEGALPCCPLCIQLEDKIGNASDTIDLKFQDCFIYEKLRADFEEYVASREQEKKAQAELARKIEEKRNAISITKVGDDIDRNEIVGSKKWNGYRGSFYGTIQEVTESESYYNGYEWINEPIYQIAVSADSGLLFSSSVYLKFKKSELPYSVIEKLARGQRIYFKGNVKIDEFGSIEIKNCELIL